MATHVVTEIPPLKFVEFLPKVEDAATPIVDFGAVPEGPSKLAKDMFTPFAHAIDNSGCCPGFAVREASSMTNLEPEYAMFEKNVYPSSSGPRTSALSLMDVIVQFKSHLCKDRFSRFDDDDEEDSEHQPEVPWSQIMDINIVEQSEYASKLMTLQHRSRIFSLHIVGHYARLIHWDRAGATASERFNYYDGTNNFLGEFLFRYSKATREQRGFDRHVKRANEDEVGLLDAAVKEHLRQFRYPAYLQSSLARTVDESYPAYSVHVEDDATHEEGDYIVCRPSTKRSSLVAHEPITWGYLAWGMRQQKLVFLMDIWFPEGTVFFSEAAAYDSLRELGSDNLNALLPAVIACGDVRQSDGSAQRTLTTDPQWRYIRQRVVQELALPLCMVQNSKQLLQAIRNTLEVIMIAYHQGGILHQDISASSIMLTQEFTGILNDWDRAVRVDPDSPSPIGHRTGTWRFMSVDVLEDKMGTKPHNILDDVESAFWVFSYHCLHYFKRTPGLLQGFIGMFDETGERFGCDGQRHAYGGQTKWVNLYDFRFRMIEFESKPLTRALRNFAEILGMHHIAKMTPENDPVASYRAILESQGTHVLEEVAGIIEIFDKEIASGDWPESDDAVEEQFPDFVALFNYPEMADSDSDQASSSTGAANCGCSLTGPAPYPLSRTSLKRPLEEDDEDEEKEQEEQEEQEEGEEGTPYGRLGAKRRKLEGNPEPGMTGIISQFVGALACKARRVFSGR